MPCLNHSNSSCPFADTEESEVAQSYGCLPSMYDIISMRVNHDKTWSCHDEPTKPCVGAINFLKQKRLPYQVIDSSLITESDDWSRLVSPLSDETLTLLRGF